MYSNPSADSDPHTEAKRFGEFVATMRQRMQLAGYRRVSQEVLADLMGTNKSQISRIENGKAHVTRRTVDNLAVALQLSPKHRQRLYHLAGFHGVSAASLLPQRGDFERVAGPLRESWLSLAPPAAALIDASGTIWEANPVFTRLFSTRTPADLAQRHLLDLAFDPELGLRDALHGLVEDNDLTAFLRGRAATFAARHVHDQRAAWYRDLLQRLSANRDFTHVWDEVSSKRGNVMGEQGVLRFIGGGRLFKHTMRVSSDQRFRLLLLIPADLTSARILEECP